MTGMKRFYTKCPKCSWDMPLVAHAERDINYWFCPKCGRYFDTAGRELMLDEVDGKPQVESLLDGLNSLSNLIKGSPSSERRI